MGSFYSKFTYKQMLMIKHALFYRLMRDGISRSDYDSEEALLMKVEDLIKTAEEKINRRKRGMSL